MTSPHYQAVIFDLYGVLALNGWQAFKAQHFRGRPEAWSEVYEMGRQVDAGLASYDEFVRLAAEHAGEPISAVRYQLEHTQPNHELLEYIAHELPGRFKLGILSNASQDKVIEQIFTPDQRALFHAITLSHHVGLTKPDARIYRAAAHRLDVEPEQCIFVDDQERHVTGAREAGMYAIVYTDVAALQKELAKV